MEVYEVEQWALRVVKAIRETGRVEDILVEVKAKPQAGNAAARRLAGHANAARGERILWVFGIEEKSGQFFTVSEEPSTWYKQVKAEFESDWPELEVDRHVDCDGGRVWAVCFGTRAWPYVVRNERFNSEGGGPVQWEVPVRIGTEVRSARRIDLVGLLDRVAQTPRIEQFSAHVESQPASDGKATMIVRVMVYCMPHDEHEVCIPFHKCSGRLIVGEKALDVIRVRVSPRLEAALDGRGASRERSFDPNVVYSGSDVRVAGTAPLLLSGLAVVTGDELAAMRGRESLEAEFDLGLARGLAPIRVRYSAHN